MALPFDFPLFSITTVAYFRYPISMYTYFYLVCMKVSAVTSEVYYTPIRTSCVHSIDMFVMGQSLSLMLQSLFRLIESKAKKSPVLSPIKMWPLSYGPYERQVMYPRLLNNLTILLNVVSRSYIIMNGMIRLCLKWEPAKKIFRGSTFCERCIVSNSRSCQSSLGTIMCSTLCN